METTHYHNFSQTKYRDTLKNSGCNLDVQGNDLIRRMEFSASTKYTLAGRVGYKCSICNHETIGPDDKGRFTILGEAAHICGAIIDGNTKSPRARADITPEQCSSIENGIWLCCNCHKHVDSCVKRFSELQLYQYKYNAESAQMQRLMMPYETFEEHFDFNAFDPQIRSFSSHSWTAKEWCLFCFFFQQKTEYYQFDTGLSNGFVYDYPTWVSEHGINYLTAGLSHDGQFYGNDFNAICNKMTGVINLVDNGLRVGDKYYQFTDFIFQNFGDNVIDSIIDGLKA